MRRLLATISLGVVFACGCSPDSKGPPKEKTTPNISAEEPVSAPSELEKTKPDSAFAPADTLSNQTTTMENFRGSFLEIQEGDYLHFVAKDAAGEVRSFWISPDMPEEDYMPFLTMKHRAGTEVEVLWKKVTRDIPESGGDLELEEAQEIRVVD